jgi:O-methyltransferase
MRALRRLILPRFRRARTRARNAANRTISRRATRLLRVVSLPATVLFLFHNRRIHPAYAMTWRRKLALAVRMYRNTQRVFTGTSYKAHLAMAVKLFEIPPDVEGDVVECGCYLGGSTANLSLACEIVGRRLVVYDSFEGLPTPQEGDKYATDQTEGFLRADIDVVRSNVARLGAIDRCEFRKGWFEDTLPGHETPIVLCFLDVDYQASLRDCVLNLWPKLTEQGYVFIDEYVLVDYCALFFSEKFWGKYFGAKPPGLLGVGTGLGLGEYYLGPWEERLPIQSPGSIAYTRKDLSGVWEFYPDED